MGTAGWMENKPKPEWTANIKAQELFKNLKMKGENVGFGLSLPIQNRRCQFSESSQNLTKE